VRLKHCREAFDSRSPGVRVGQQRRDIVEQNTGFWEIGDRADVLFEVHDRRPVCELDKRDALCCEIAAFGVVGKPSRGGR
jgi:hypothetical protein